MTEQSFAQNVPPRSAVLTTDEEHSTTLSPSSPIAILKAAALRAEALPAQPEDPELLAAHKRAYTLISDVNKAHLSTSWYPPKPELYLYGSSDTERCRILDRLIFQATYAVGDELTITDIINAIDSSVDRSRTYVQNKQEELERHPDHPLWINISYDIRHRGDDAFLESSLFSTPDALHAYAESLHAYAESAARFIGHCITVGAYDDARRVGKTVSTNLIPAYEKRLEGVCAELSTAAQNREHLIRVSHIPGNTSEALYGGFPFPIMSDQTDALALDEFLRGKPRQCYATVDAVPGAPEEFHLRFVSELYAERLKLVASQGAVYVCIDGGDSFIVDGRRTYCLTALSSLKMRCVIPESEFTSRQTTLPKRFKATAVGLVANPLRSPFILLSSIEPDTTWREVCGYAIGKTAFNVQVVGWNESRSGLIAAFNGNPCIFIPRSQIGTAANMLPEKPEGTVLTVRIIPDGSFNPQEVSAVASAKLVEDEQRIEAEIRRVQAFVKVQTAFRQVPPAPIQITLGEHQPVSRWDSNRYKNITACRALVYRALVDGQDVGSINYNSLTSQAKTGDTLTVLVVGIEPQDGIQQAVFSENAYTETKRKAAQAKLKAAVVSGEAPVVEATYLRENSGGYVFSISYDGVALGEEGFMPKGLARDYFPSDGLTQLEVHEINDDTGGRRSPYTLAQPGTRGAEGNRETGSAGRSLRPGTHFSPATVQGGSISKPQQPIAVRVYTKTHPDDIKVASVRLDHQFAELLRKVPNDTFYVGPIGAPFGRSFEPGAPVIKDKTVDTVLDLLIQLSAFHGERVLTECSIAEGADRKTAVYSDIYSALDPSKTYWIVPKRKPKQ